MFGDDDLRAEDGKPRVEGEVVAAIVAMEWDGLRSDEVMRDLALDLLDARNEVKRLTKEKARACQMAFEEGAIWGYTGPTGAAIQAEAELRYPRPTSEAK